MIKSITDIFKGISLSEMEGVKLMNRRDRKFCINATLLDDILTAVADDYYLLEIEGERNLLYATTYFDTENNEMYTNHHRGKKNRYKIRRRTYCSSNISFLEVKFKSNKGRTVKTRRISDYNGEFAEEEKEFISKSSPYECAQIDRVIENGFRRMTLVSKEMNERCTIDSELVFQSNNVEARLDDLIIIEVKTEGNGASPIITALNERRIRPTGFSKYCMGRSITDSSLKQNRFRLKHRIIERTIKKEISSLITNLNR